MNRLFFVAAILGGLWLTSPSASGQGIGVSDSRLGYAYPAYQTYYPIQVRPSGYAAGFTYTYPTIYPSAPYFDSYGYRRGFGYPSVYRGPVLRSYYVTPSRPGSQFGTVHSSQYIGNPHASQYLGR